MRTILAAALAASTMLAGCSTAAVDKSTTASIAPAATEVVKVVLPDGHGSGTHIGNGYILTAAHVVGGSQEVTLKASNGSEQKGTVLWANRTYDVALVRAEHFDGLAAAHLSCRTASAGEDIEARGNPLLLEFVSSWGRIAGGERELGPWKDVLITDMTTVMGMSGGGVFDVKGDMIGITVGVMSVPMGFSASLTGFGAIVPSSVACMLMAKDTDSGLAH